MTDEARAREYWRAWGVRCETSVEPPKARRSGGRPWSPADTERLRSAWQDSQGLKSIARVRRCIRATGRTEMAVRGKLLRMGLWADVGG
jgi:hypothetical protein